MGTFYLLNLDAARTFGESHKKINIVCLFTVFGPRQHVFEETVYLRSFSLFNSFFFIVSRLQYYISFSC